MESSARQYSSTVKVQQPYTITRDKFMNMEQAKLLLKTCEEMAELDVIKGRRTWVTRNMFVALLMRTGLRISEAAGLQIMDIHISSNTDNFITVRKGKGGRRRDVYISPPLKVTLKKYITIKSKSWRQPTGLTLTCFPTLMVKRSPVPLWIIASAKH